MDCNKEDATRALALAENKMRSGDFTDAQKLVLKAQSLFSGLDSLPKMLAVCDVHSSADKKINGLDNWYGILQVMHFADDATIKKQYRKLALLLHPDKNQFPGAEAAFQLVMEASTLLADKEKRSQYDIKRRIYSRTATTQSNANSNPQSAAANNAGASIINNRTFWTRCEHCGYRYKYMVEYVNALLYCSSCQRSHIAYNTGFNGVPAQSTADHQEGHNQGPYNTSSHKNVECNGAQPGNAAAEVDNRESLNKKLSQKNGGGDKKNAEVRKSKTENESWKTENESWNKYAELSKSEKGEGKRKNTAELPKADVSNQQPAVTEPETGASNSVPDASMSKGKNKRRKFGEEPTKSMNNEHKADLKDINRRKSPRKRQQDSCAKDGSCNDYISPPTKKSKSSVRSSRRPDSGGSSSVSCAYKGKSKKKVDSRYQETSGTKGRKINGCEESGEPVVMAGKIGNNHKTNEKPVSQVLPDPDFNNFELTTSCFAVNQVWSLYDSTDGMPRFYARIKKVLDSEFKLSIMWIDPLQDSKDNSTPIACGIFQDGDSEEVDDLFMFSSQMLHLPSDNNIIIYPRKGEIWAVFRGWDMSWSACSEYHKRPYEYDYVEVLSDFTDEDGVGVAYLAKVEGFVSLFRRDAQHGVFQLQIPPSEMLRFSHKSPSFKMTGKEREGVPPGCFELDTLALPKDMFEVDTSKVDVKLDRQKLNGKTAGPFPEASEIEVQAKTTLHTSSSPKQRKKVQDKNCSFSKASDGKCTDHEKNSLKKSRKSGKAVGDLKLQKSSRLCSEINNQATSSSPNTTEKKSAKCGTSCVQPDEFCISPEKPEKVITMDSSSIRDLDKLTGNSKKHGKNDEPLSHSRGNGLPNWVNGAIKCSGPQTHVASSCTTREEKTSNFENQRSWDKFRIDQIWAIYSDAGMPRKYGQIKKMDTNPEFKLHVAPLELYPSPTLMTHPVCCGCFKLKTGKAEVLAPSSFSHQVKAVKTKINRFEIYPEKSEVWALYRNGNTRGCAETEELEIVEVVETKEQSIQVAPLTAKGFKKPLYRRSEESSKADFIEIPKTEVSRFSHQIPAFRHERRATRFGDSECWELDPKAVDGL